MKILIRIAVSLVGIMITLMLIEALTGVHIGLVDVFNRLAHEFRKSFLFM